MDQNYVLAQDNIFKNYYRFAWYVNMEIIVNYGDYFSLAHGAN